MQGLGTSDYRGGQQSWHSLVRGNNDDDEEDGYFPPLVLKRGKHGGNGSVSGTTSGLTTPGGTAPTNGRGKILSEQDLAAADAALSNHSTA
ncbi:hypothetical protein Rhopal_006275-T1 [Rhodotorula paludigena]|uniref:Uncharacterized protein n=1 Tax=Rhodotorula paludigena TaxID=86838 RepID=A0AAV5GSL9_9BASI|nr:hypothetical protein Rhopal_006275-T1 [Rhodotorula paludigena]